MAQEQLALDATNDPRLQIGANQPPLSERIAEEIAPLLATRDQLLASAESALIIDGESAAKVVDLAKQMSNLEDMADLVREEMIRPHLLAQREINSSFGTVTNQLKLARQGADGRGGLRLMLTQWQRKLEVAAQAERDRLAAAQRLREAEAEAARRAAEEKKAAGSTGVADELTAMQAEEAAQRLARQAEAIRPEPVRSHLGMAGTRREIVFEITDVRKLLGWLLKSPLRVQVEAAVTGLMRPYLRNAIGVDGVEKGVEIPGLTARIERVAQIRS
jgi:hypothetical protein